ncbi:MAG: helix-turn-helix domain-containing protein [Lysinibacillus sp.]
MTELLEVTEVSKLLKCNKNKVYDLIKSGALQGLKLGRMKVSTIELNNFLQRNAGMDLSDPYNIKPLFKGGEEIENQHS